MKLTFLACSHTPVEAKKVGDQRCTTCLDHKGPTAIKHSLHWSPFGVFAHINWDTVITPFKIVRGTL